MPPAERWIRPALNRFRRPSQTGGGKRWRQYAATTLAIAASFLLALVVVHSWSGGPHSPGTSVVEKAVKELPLPPPAAQTADDLETVTLAAIKSSDGPAETVRVRAQRRDAFDQALLEQIPDAIPPELQQAFEQSGHRIVQQREIVPIQMNDGRRLLVPVDRIQIPYVGRPAL